MSQLPLRVLVIGGGLGGLCLAQALHQAGVNVAVYERDNSPVARNQGYRVHIDTHGEQALLECLPPSLFELFLASRGQESKGLTVFSIVDGQLKEAFTRRFPASGSSDVINTITSPKWAFMCHESKLAKICVSLSVENWPCVSFGMKLAKFCLGSVESVYGAMLGRLIERGLREQLIRRLITKKSPVSFQNLQALQTQVHRPRC